MEQVDQFGQPVPQKQPLWNITGTKDDTEFLPTGPIPVVKVNFTVLGVVDSSVSVPKEKYSAQLANTMVHKLAVELAQTLGLEGPDINQGAQTQPFVYTPE